jgi:hypothetical protein
MAEIDQSAEETRDPVKRQDIFGDDDEDEEETEELECITGGSKRHQ